MVEGLPKVSVIIPGYNAHEHLKDCLDSVCRQTLSEYEVIYIDDCSTDNSLEILHEYAESYDFLKIIQQPVNMGAGPARNVGLDNAKGEYIAFMDADDLYPNEHVLELLYTTAVNKAAQVCGGGILFQFPDKIVAGKNGNENFCFDKEGWIDYAEYQQYYYYQRFIFSREMLQNYGICFPDYLRFQDPPFFVKAMVSAGRFYALTESVYIYRNDSTHVKWNDRKVNDFLKGSLNVIDLCRENRLDKIYFAMLNRFLNNQYTLEIIENSLINGNDRVLEFYRSIVDNLDYELLGASVEKLDLQYAEILANANLKRNLHYNHKPIELQNDDEEKPAPKVTVVVPVYNTKEYLSLCLGSIVGQTLEDIEIVCVDDGSTDGSSEVLAKFERKYKNLKVYRQENGGLSAARNTGIQHAHGKYLYFMDSDDYLDLIALEELYETAEAEQLDIVFFGAKSFFETPEDALDKKNQYYVNAYKRLGSYPDALNGKEMLVKQQANKDYYTSVCIQFFRTQFLRENTLAFYEGLLHEDNLFSLAAIVAAQRVRCINNIYFYRRIRHDSIMTSPVNYRNVLGYYLTAVEEVKLLHDVPMTDAERKTVLDKIQAMFKSHVNYKWPRLHRADQVLFAASLSSEDRMLFDSFVRPMIDYHERIRNSSEAIKKEKLFKDEVTTLKKEINNSKKTTVNNSSRSYRIGRVITYIPRKIKGGLLCYKQHGLKYTVRRVGKKIKNRLKWIVNIKK